MAERYQLPRSCVPPTARRKDCGYPPSGGLEGGKARCIRERETWSPFKGVTLLLKATLPTCVPSRRGLSLLQHAPRSSPLQRGDWVPHVMQAGPEQKKPNRRARCMQPPSGYKRLSTSAQTSGRKGGQPCRRNATAPGGRTSPTSNTPSMEAQAHASCNRCAGCFVQATAPPLAPLPRLLDCGTNTATRGDPAHDLAAPAWRDGQCGQKRAGSNGGGRRAGAAVTSSSKLTSHPGAVREPSLTALRRRARVPFLEWPAHAQRPPREPLVPSH
jgi:hypothetical protein